MSHSTQYLESVVSLAFLKLRPNWKEHQLPAKKSLVKMILVDPNSCCEIQVDAIMENAIGVEGRGHFWMSGDHYFKWIACTCL